MHVVVYVCISVLYKFGRKPKIFTWVLARFNNSTTFVLNFEVILYSTCKQYDKLN